MSRSVRPRLGRLLALALLGASPAAPALFAQSCPALGWEENLTNYLKPSFPFPTDDTPIGADDCAFHQWSWEAFVWAVAMDANNVPRFMTLPTPEDLLSPDASAAKIAPRALRLSARSLHAVGTPGFTEGAGAIVEADGNMLVAPNGYPVYASVHMNPSYFATAKKNLIVDGGYTSQPADSTFEVGAAVFKATWMRLDPGQAAPAGAFTTEAEVPVLTVLATKSTATVVPSGQFTKVTVALVGLHVVGYTINHPEFLWATFEHKLNAPMLPDNTFTTSGSSPNSYTFYQANTSFSQVNLQNSSPATLTFDVATQRFSPPTNVVQENVTGGENNSPNGPQNIMNVNASGQSFLENVGGAQGAFANYQLIGTVWMAPGAYNLTSDQTDAVGSVNLANSTAETFVQQATNSNQQNVQNCFMCHNPTSYNFQSNLPKLPSRLIALSHVLSVGTPYAVPNLMPVVPSWKNPATVPDAAKTSVQAPAADAAAAPAKAAPAKASGY